LLLWPRYLPAQIEVKLPSELYIYVNNIEFDPTEAWNDSLISEARNAHIKYEIATTFRNFSVVTTRIRIPQFYTIPEVMRQIIIYYYMLNDETERKNETVYIYPFFIDIHKQPAIICTYEPQNKINMTVSGWQTVPRPEQPIPEHKFLYNQLIEADLKELTSRDNIPDEIYEKVAAENAISVDELRKIYQSVKLWQLSE
jgi:hypothetical protein